MSRSLRTALALAVAFAATAPAAQAELTLRWDAPPTCPQGPDVLKRIRSLAGPSFDPNEELLAEGKITRVGSRFSLTLLVREGREVRKRVIAADSCGNLAGAAAVTLALLLGIELRLPEPSQDSDSGSTSSGGAGGSGASNTADTTAGQNASSDPGAANDRRGEQRSAQPPEEEESNSEPRPESPSASRSWSFLVRAPALAAAFGPLPDPSFGVGAGIGVRQDSWRVLLTGHLFLSQDVEGPGPIGPVGGDVTRLMAQLLTCRGFRGDGFELGPCLGLAVEHLRAQGFGEGVTPQTQSALSVAPTAGILGHWYPSESLAFFAALTGAFHLSRPRLTIVESGELTQLAPLSAGFSMGLEWIL